MFIKLALFKIAADKKAAKMFSLFPKTSEFIDLIKDIDQQFTKKKRKKHYNRKKIVENHILGLKGRDNENN